MNFINLDNYHYLHRVSKKTVPLLKKKKRFTDHYISNNETKLAVNKEISDLIIVGKPFMIARHGSVEVEVEAVGDTIYQCQKILQNLKMAVIGNTSL